VFGITGSLFNVPLPKPVQYFMAKLNFIRGNYNFCVEFFWLDGRHMVLLMLKCLFQNMITEAKRL
jgi:hypothetical protein